jgi:hypothetical protein
MPQYVLNMIQPVGAVPPPEVLEPVMRDLAALNQEMQAAGAWVFAAALHQPESSTVVRADGDDLLVIDGPYAEGKEFVGGFDLIQADDLDGALSWAGRIARIVGLPIEVRPVLERF